MKTKWAILCITVMIIGFFIVIGFKQLTTPRELTANEMTKQIEVIYDAKVQTLVKQQDRYLASFNKNGSIFEINVDPVTGQYSDLQLVHKKVAQQVETNEVQKSEDTSETPKKEQTKEDLKSEQPISSTPRTNTNSTIENTEQRQPTKSSSNSKPLLSEQQAINIALKEVPGELDSVEFENSSDGGIYLIEIEQEEVDVSVQVHAITGKILLIEFDD